MTASIVAWLFIFYCITGAFADTEIVNFGSQIHSDASYNTQLGWNILSKQNNSGIFSLSPTGSHQITTRRVEEQDDGFCDSKICEGDTWILLNLDDWFPESNTTTPERMFTLRISWPASTPTEFKVTLFPSLPLSMHATTERLPRAKGEVVDVDAQRTKWKKNRESKVNMSSPQQIQTRHMYARVRASTAKFVRAPKPDGSVFPFQSMFLPTWFLPAPIPPSQPHGEKRNEVRFHVILEPLIFGFLPESLIPGIIFLIVLLVPIAWLAVPRVNAAFAKLADRARKGKGKIE